MRRQWQFSILNPFVNGLGDYIKCLGDLVVVFSVNFDELESIFFGKVGSLVCRDCPLIFKVILISDQQYLHVRITIHLHLLQPVLDMGESIAPGDVVDKESSNGAPIVRSGNRTEVLLASRVPDLELDVFAADLDSLCPEFDTDCYVVSRPRFIFDELQHHTRLADARVADHDEFEEVVI